MLAILHAGYGTHEVVTVGAGDGKVIGRVTIKETFGGLVWSKDGKRLYVGGGLDDVIHRFDHAKGLLSNDTTIAYPTKAASPRVPAGLALAEDGSLWVANTFGHTRGEVRPEGKVRARAADGQGLVSLRPGLRPRPRAALREPLERGRGGGARREVGRGRRPLADAGASRTSS